MHVHLEMHVWEATDPPTPALMFSILSLPLFCCCAFKEPCVSLSLQ